MLGAWVDGVEARAISIDDRGLHYGDGVFETIAASGGRARFVAAHLSRLAHGCALLAIAPPNAAVLRAEIASAAALAPHVIVKVIVTRGSAIARGYAFTGAEVPRRIVYAYAWPEGPDAARAPARVGMAELRLATQPRLAGVKHLNRLEQVLARDEAQRRGFDEVILCAADDRIVGGGMSNVFLLAGDRLATPPRERCAVAGVMRAQVISVAAQFGLGVCERDVSAVELAAADAVFLTNARIGLWPAGSIDGRPLVASAWAPRLQASLAEAAMASCDHA